MPKHVGSKNLERVDKNIHCFLQHLLVLLQTVEQVALFYYQDGDQPFNAV
jgi:hypothetical protein